MRIDPCNNGVAILTLTDRVVIYAKLLGNQVDNPSLLRGEGSSESELIAHPVVLE